ncbi:MAG TPA: hypothetical protein VIF38_09595 [Burkholderiales bacterium]|jgi:hypothetical protein
MGQVGESRAAAALITLGVVISLACVSMIGAVAALVVMAAEKPAPVAAQARDDTAAGGAGSRRAVFRPLPASRPGERAVIVWNTGMIYCMRDKPAQVVPAEHSGFAAVVQAQAGD